MKNVTNSARRSSASLVITQLTQAQLEIVVGELAKSLVSAVENSSRVKIAAETVSAVCANWKASRGAFLKEKAAFLSQGNTKAEGKRQAVAEVARLDEIADALEALQASTAECLKPAPAVIAA